MRISDWSLDVCSSDLTNRLGGIFPDELCWNAGEGTSFWGRRGVACRDCLSGVGAADERCGRGDGLRQARKRARCQPVAGRIENRDGRSRRSEEHTSELQSLMRISYAVFCLKKKKTKHIKTTHNEK